MKVIGAESFPALKYHQYYTITKDIRLFISNINFYI